MSTTPDSVSSSFEFPRFSGDILFENSAQECFRIETDIDHGTAELIRKWSALSETSLTNIIGRSLLSYLHIRKHVDRGGKIGKLLFGSKPRIYLPSEINQEPIGNIIRLGINVNQESANAIRYFESNDGTTQNRVLVASILTYDSVREYQEINGGHIDFRGPKKTRKQSLIFS